MIMTDQDPDGSHIKGLLLNFFHYNWPEILQHDFLEMFITPIIKAFLKNTVKSFYSLSEYRNWQRATVDADQWRIKYYKGELCTLLTTSLTGHDFTDQVLELPRVQKQRNTSLRLKTIGKRFIIPARKMTTH